MTDSASEPLCPLLRHQLQTLEGFEAMDVITRSLAHLRHLPSGTVAGFDVAASIRIAELLGYDARSFTILLPYAEQALTEALQTHDQRQQESVDPSCGD